MVFTQFASGRLANCRSFHATFTERWTFALSGPESQPWRLVGAGGDIDLAA